MTDKLSPEKIQEIKRMVKEQSAKKDVNWEFLKNRIIGTELLTRFKIIPESGFWGAVINIHDNKTSIHKSLFTAIEPTADNYEKILNVTKNALELIVKGR